MRALLPLALSFALGGCIVYDEKLVCDDGTPVPDNPTFNPCTSSGPDHTDVPSDDPTFTLTPDAGSPGETVIVFVEADGPVLGDIELARFFGPSDLEVTATAANGDAGLVVTVEIPANAAPGANDLLLEPTTGAAIFLEEAFFVE
ncbi:MAG: hypothetical protein R3F61_18940 [Myxococcota bacterium]